MSSNPPFFHKLIPNAWKSTSIPRSQYEGKFPLSSPSTVTRIRSLTLIPPHGHDYDRLPLYLNATEMEKLDFETNPNSPLKLSKLIVCLTFHALGYQTMSTSQDHPSILGPAMVIAFVASLSAILLSNNYAFNNSYPRVVSILEIVGILFFALSFLVMIKGFFSGKLVLWDIMVVLGMAWTILALLIRFFTR